MEEAHYIIKKMDNGAEFHYQTFKKIEVRSITNKKK